MSPTTFFSLGAQHRVQPTDWPVLAIGEAPNARDHDGSGNGVALWCEAYEEKLPGLKQLRRVNLLPSYPGRMGRGSAFPMREARAAADVLWASQPLDVRFLILSLRAAEAFQIRRLGLQLAEWFEQDGRIVAVIPHPSGIVRWWNEGENREKAGAFMKGLVA